MSNSERARILVVDDEENIVEVMRSALLSEGYDVQATSDPLRAERMLEENEYDLVVTDLKMTPVDGLGLLRRCKERDPHMQVLLITAFSTVETAVEAMKAGAFDYIVKPFKLSELKLVVRRALEHRATIVENDQLKAMLRQKYDLSNIVGESPAMQRVFERIRKVADTDATVLITGESGTGKELVAKAIFANSRRHDKPFVSINCGALPETLLESELFGYVKGAFTGAIGDKRGLFQAADGGTIFLDEIGLTSPALQVRLLRVLQEREVRRVGDTKDFKVDVRVIAATNEDLQAKVREGKFREDLYYRLSVIPIHIPPLRERASDIPLLVQHFLDRINTKTGRRYRASKEFLDLLTVYEWPGNIRELENVIERATALAEGNILRPEDLPDNIVSYRSEGVPKISRELRAVVEETERAHIARVLDETGGNKRLAARIMGIDLATLYRKMERLGIKG
ncbi:MAG: sigma-54 dependent transcriptional regulator [bacterium]|nr:sigma-54 dependent transcriptional regulator [bacterium]